MESPNEIFGGEEEGEESHHSPLHPTDIKERCDGGEKEEDEGEGKKGFVFHGTFGLFRLHGIFTTE